MDFGSLGTSSHRKAPIDPIKLFESLPSLENTPNDLWRGQAEALSNWHTIRKNMDVLVSLNTGAGKTIVGLLMAQSLVNEGVENVIYVCSTIDLVKQTALEAQRIGIPCTTRVKKQFSNDLFETDKSFCITTYHALFNGHSVLRRKYFPGAVIFDDAHVAENILRDAFTIRIPSANNEELFNELAKLFEPHFTELGVAARFKASLSYGEQATSFAAPRGVQQRAAQIYALFEKYNLRQDNQLTYAYEHIKDHIETCAVVFTRGVFEISPPFLPSLALDVFEQHVRRIYLSATLQSKTEFIRAFGRLPSKIVEPSNDAGNGERLIIDGRYVKDGFSKEYVRLVSEHKKIVIAVPTYLEAEKWSYIAAPPSTEHFSEMLDEFRKAATGAFVLVSRVDGIDLPHDTCRLMLMDGLPTGTSLIERYQWEFLRMNNVHAARVANRLAQLFGRINRGRNDYGIFLIEGTDLGVWLAKDRNVSLLPPLLQKQIMLGRSVQSGLNVDNTEAVSMAMDAVLNRDKGWLDYYEREVKLGELDRDQIERAEIAEPVLLEATLAEAQYAALMWNRDYTGARRALELKIDKVASTDTPLGGWHSVWVGAAYDLEQDQGSANRYYCLARSRIGDAISLPRANYQTLQNSSYDLNSFALSLKSYLGYTSGGKCEEEITALKSELSMIDRGTPKQAESAVRKLGELLGFRSTRPDNDEGTGPDVLWYCEESNTVVGFELKTNKKSPANYQKKDIAQGHDHISWIEHNYSGSYRLGLLYVGPDGRADSKANPSQNMGLCTVETIVNLRDQVLAVMDDIMRSTPLERADTIEKVSILDEWKMKNLVRQLWCKSLG